MIYLPILFGALTFGFFAGLGAWCEHKFRTDFDLEFTGVAVGLILGVAVCCVTFADVADGSLDGRVTSVEAKK